MGSIWRGMMNKEFETISIGGETLDLGGPQKSEYSNLFQGEYHVTCTDFDPNKKTDLSFDFEEPFPIAGETYNSILCVNVLEHIFNYQNLLNESYRILMPGGTMVSAVPFLIRVHPSPNDYWRYTEQTLNKIFTEAGFTEVEVRPIGRGVFSAVYSMLHNIFHFRVIRAVGKAFACILDSLLLKIAPNSLYTKKNFPLGYIVVAQK